jgi:predicted tellurium resistance membrane protein TerC
MHSLYFIAYAGFITVAGIIMAAAFYARFKNEGTPINGAALALTAAVAHSMWTGAAFTEYVYAPSDLTVAYVVAALSIWIAAGIAWQVSGMVRKQQAADLI